MSITRTFPCSKDVRLIHTSDGRDGGVGAGDVLSVGMTAAGSKTRSELELALDHDGIVLWSSAPLRLRVTNTCGNVGAAVDFYVEELTSGFQEGKVADTCEVGADNAEKWPGQGSTTTNRVRYTGTPSAGDVISIDLAAMLEAARADGRNSLLIRLVSQDENDATKYVGFWSREKGNGGAGYKPRIEAVGEDVYPPDALQNVSPATTDSEGPLVAATQVERSFAVTGRFTSRNAGDYATASDVQFYDATATDDGAGAILTGTRIGTLSGDGSKTDYPVGTLDIRHPITVPAALVGDEIRGRVRVRNQRGKWGPWTRLADMRLIPNSRPTAPTHLRADVGNKTPTYRGSHNDPDPGSSVSQVQTQVWKRTASGGYEIIENQTTFVPGDPETGPLTTLNGDGGQDVSGGTEWAVPHTGRPIALNERVNRRHRTVDQYGAVGAWSAAIAWTRTTPGAGLEVPAALPDSSEKQDDLTPNLGYSYPEDVDTFELEAYSDDDLNSTKLWASGSVAVSPAAPSAVIGYGSVGDAMDLDWGMPLWVRRKVRVDRTSTWTDWSDLEFVWINALSSAPSVSIEGAVLGPKGYIVVPSQTPRITAPFADPDLPNDSPTRQRIRAYQAQTGAGPSGPFGTSPIWESLVTSDIQDGVDVPFGTFAWETSYGVTATYADSSAQYGASSGRFAFLVHRPPTVAVGTAPDPLNPTPLIPWLATFYGGATQAGYRVAIDDMTDPDNPDSILDTGFVADPDAVEYLVDPYVLPDATPLRAVVWITDTEGVTTLLDTTTIVSAAIAADLELEVPDIVAISSNLTAPSDSFTRVTATGWGTATSGHVWEYLGLVSVFDTDGAVGEIELDAGVAAGAFLSSVSYADTTVLAKIRTDKPVLGAPVQVGVLGHVNEDGDYYRAVLRFNTDATVDILIGRVVRGTYTLLASWRSALTHAALTWFWIKMSIDATVVPGIVFVSAKGWQDGSAEPGTWQVSTSHGDYSAAILGPGSVGVNARAAGGITNEPLTIWFDSFSATSP